MGTDFIRTILDTLPDPVFVKDEHHVWILLNEAYCKFMGHPREALIGKTDYDFFPKEEADVFYRLDDELFATGVTNENEEMFTDSSGQVHVIATKKALCRDDAGNKVIVGVIRDITARARAEEEVRRARENLEQRVRERTSELERANAELRESEQRFRATFEQAAVGIAHTSLDGRFLRVNRRLCEILDRSQEELLGHPFSEFTFSEDVSLSTAWVHDLVDGRVPVVSADKRYVRGDGSIVWAHLTTALAHDAQGQPTYFITVVEDVSSRKGAEQALEASQAQLRHAQKMEAIGRLAGGVAHDFNNLLLVISMSCNLAVKRVPPDSHARGLLDESLNAAKRAAALTRQLLAFSRQQVAQMRVLFLNELVEEIATMARRLIGEDVTLRTTLAPDGWSVRVDSDQITQLFMNLVVNARDAMPDGGELTIKTANVTVRDVGPGDIPPGEYLVTTVSDTGCGMDEATRVRVFEPFFTTKPAGQGTGLGLATAYGIVKQSGGTIVVHSEVGQGTTFEIYLPHVASPDAPASVASPVPTATAGRETILFVDDEAMVRRVVEEILREHGYVVLVAESPESALEIAATHAEPIGLLLTDVVMPGMNGRQLAERIVALHPETKVVFTSGYAPATIRGVGGETFVQKPFDEQDLIEALRNALAHRSNR